MKMPQLMPLSWIFSFFVFILFMVMYFFVYEVLNYHLSNTLNEIKKEKLMWLW